MATRGMLCTSHQVALPGPEPAEAGLSWAPRSLNLKSGWVWMEALPPVPFLVSLNSYKNIDHCKSDCQIGN